MTWSSTKNSCECKPSSEWKSFEGSCYQYASTGKTYIEAKTDCANKNARIAIVNSQRLFNFIKNLNSSSTSFVSFLFLF